MKMGSPPPQKNNNTGKQPSRPLPAVAAANSPLSRLPRVSPGPAAAAAIILCSLRGPAAAIAAGFGEEAAAGVKRLQGPGEGHGSGERGDGGRGKGSIFKWGGESEGGGGSRAARRRQAQAEPRFSPLDRLVAAARPPASQASPPTPPQQRPPHRPSLGPRFFSRSVSVSFLPSFLLCSFLFSSYRLQAAPSLLSFAPRLSPQFYSLPHVTHRVKLHLRRVTHITHTRSPLSGSPSPGDRQAGSSSGRLRGASQGSKRRRACLGPPPPPPPPRLCALSAPSLLAAYGNSRAALTEMPEGG